MGIPAIGWAKPVPVNYRNLKKTEKMKSAIKNEKIKSDAENEINYAIIKNDAGEDINSNLREERKSFGNQPKA